MKNQKGYANFLKKLFVGREDVVAIYWKDSKKSGYSPLCSNKGERDICNSKCSTCSYQQFIPVSDSLLSDHIKGNKILGLPSKSEVAMAAICVLEKGQALKIISGQRHMTLKAKDLGHYAGARGRRGSALPRGWRKVERMLAE